MSTETPALALVVLAVGDAIGVLRHLFGRRADRVSCLDAADIDDSGQIELRDPILLLLHLFGQRPHAMPTPRDECGLDPTPDALGCSRHPTCNPDPPLPDLEGASGVFFCIDRSGNLWFRVRDSLVPDVTERLLALSPEQQFAIVFFDQGVLKFPRSGRPAQATPENVAAALAWLAVVSGGSGTCSRDGLLASLEAADAASGDRPAILNYTDGGGTCRGTNELDYLRETLEVVARENRARVPIHSIDLGSGNAQEQYLRDLAEMNDGVYVRFAGGCFEE